MQVLLFSDIVLCRDVLIVPLLIRLCHPSWWSADHDSNFRCIPLCTMWYMTMLYLHTISCTSGSPQQDRT